MKLEKGKINGIEFYYREGFSDLKTFQEVIGNETYLKIWSIIERHSAMFTVAEIGNTGRFKTRDYDLWQKSWFPACTNVFCYAKN